MISAGSMVALKGHHRFPMVVADIGDMREPGHPFANEDGKMSVARVRWLDAHGVPHSELFATAILEEVDG